MMSWQKYILDKKSPSQNKPVNPLLEKLHKNRLEIIKISSRYGMNKKCRRPARLDTTVFYCAIYFVCALRLAIFLDGYADAGTGSISRDAHWFLDVRFPPRNSILFTVEMQHCVGCCCAANVISESHNRHNPAIVYSCIPVIHVGEARTLPIWRYEPETIVKQ